MTEYKRYILKQEHQGVNSIFSHFLYFFRIIRIIWKHNNKNQVAKILSPPGFEPGTSDTGLKTKKAIFRKRGPLFRPEVIDRFCWFSIANIGRQQTFLDYKFGEDRRKIATVRVPHSKTHKMAAMTSSDQHFQNLRKVSSQNLVKIMWSKFHQNRPNSVQIKGCDRRTHTHTHIHTDAQTGLVLD